MFANYTLYHYSREPLELDTKYLYPQPWVFDLYLKPNGLWMSIDDEWLQWCKREGCFVNFTSMNYYRSRLTVAEYAKIYVVDCVEKLQHLMSFRSGIERWASLYPHYDGVAFLNYNELRDTISDINHKTFWYYSIDIPCLCIWNVSVLKVAEAQHIVM